MLLVLLVPILRAQQLIAGQDDHMCSGGVEWGLATLQTSLYIFSALQASSMAYVPPSQLTNPGPHIMMLCTS